MYAKALVLASTLVAVAGPANASGPTDAAGDPGQAAARADERPRSARASAEHPTAGHPVSAGHVQDDYAAALAQARRRHVPVVVDVWAPW